MKKNPKQNKLKEINKHNQCQHSLKTSELVLENMNKMIPVASRQAQAKMLGWKRAKTF